jgi:hypothetical protein
MSLGLVLLLIDVACIVHAAKTVRFALADKALRS